MSSQLPTLSRRGLLRATGAGLAVSFLAGCALPVIPKRPSPDANVAMGWIRFAEGRFTLYVPRAEMGQNILTALKQVACDELGIAWDQLDAMLPDTTQIEARCRTGAWRLLRTKDPVAEVGFLSGFSDQAHFSREMQRRVGMPPAAYRAAFGAEAPTRPPAH